MPEQNSPSGKGETMRWTLPNVLSVIRIVGSPLLLVLAWFDQVMLFLLAYVVLGATDLIDGILARWLQRSTDLGAKLDSIADALLSLALVAGVLHLRWELVSREWIWILLPVIAYGIAVTISCSRFGRLPTFHTRGAKVSHFLVAVAGIVLLVAESVIPLRIAGVVVLLSNLEMVAIAMQLRRWRSNVPSLFHICDNEDRQ